MSKYIVTDGAKSIDLPAYPDSSWTWLSNPPASGDVVLYAKVAAVYRAANLSADAVANMPFALVDTAGNDYDVSGEWQNKVGFLPDPYELLRMWRMSLFMTNTAYGRMGRNVARKPKTLHYVAPSTMTPNFSAAGDLVNFTRTVNGKQETMQLTDVLYMWRKDYAIEAKASENTEFAALANAAGVMYYSDLFISNYFKRGGVRPTFIGIKGVVSKDVKEEMERGVSAWMRNVSKQVAKLFNAEAVDVKTIGDGVGELKDNATYKQALENVAIAAGMPISLLLANSANYATAQVEYMQWFRDSVTPRCTFIANKLTEQIFAPLGLRFEFRPEMTDPNQEDEVSRAAAFSTFADAFNKYPDAETFLGSALAFGFELPDALITAVQKHYSKKAEPKQEEPKQEAPVIEPVTEPEPVKFVPSIEQVREMELWQTFAFRKLRKGQPLDFPFEVRSLPADIADNIRLRLIAATDEASINAAFAIDAEPQSEIALLAQAINRLANGQHNN